MAEKAQETVVCLRVAVGFVAIPDVEAIERPRQGNLFSM